MKSIMNKGIFFLLVVFWIPQTAFAEKVWCSEKGHSFPRIGAMVYGIDTPEWASRYDLLAANISNSKAQSIKALNPITKILFMIDWNVAAHLGNEIPEDFCLKTGNGHYIGIYGFTVDPYVNQRAPNLSDMCPAVAGEMGWEWFARAITEMRDLTIFDGLATDGLFGGGGMKRGTWMGDAKDDGGIDLNLDQQGESADTIESSWNQGISSMLARIRNLMGSEKLLVINSGVGFQDHPSMTGIHGAIIEYAGDVGDPPYWDLNIYQTFVENALKPHATLFPFCHMYQNPYTQTAPFKDNYTYVRFGLTRTLLSDGYYGYTDRYNPGHLNTKWYDEFETDLGYPTTTMLKLGERDVWVRFFDKGAVICNITGETALVTDIQLQEISGYDGPYHRFQGGQVPVFNNGEPFDEVLLFGELYEDNDIPKRTGDGIILLKTPEKVISDIIVDNDDTTTSPGSTIPEFVGSWTTVFEQNDNYAVLVASSVGKTLDADGINEFSGYSVTTESNAHAIYRPQIGVAGKYRVYEWHGHHHGQEAVDAKYTINHGTGSEEFIVNQQLGQGRWNELGTFDFNAGTSGNLVVSGEASTGAVIADAVKWVYVHSCTPGESRSCITADRCPGEEMCIEEDVWGECESRPLDHEVCGNGIDDDCNGVIDDPDLCDVSEPGCDLELFITSDDSYELYVNDELLGVGDVWFQAQEYSVFLEPGEHIISIAGYNSSDSNGEPNPAGVLADIHLCGEDISTNIMWGASEFDEVGWRTSLDIEWPAATVIAEYGEGVWGQYHGGLVEGIPDGTIAKWIWLETTSPDQYAYFRRVVSVEDKTPDAPDFRWVEPGDDEIVRGKDGFNLVWEGEVGADPDAEVNLYYRTEPLDDVVTDPTMIDGTLINTGGALPLAGDVSELHWDTSLLPDGVYYVYAEVYDANYHLVFSAPGSVELTSGGDKNDGCTCSSHGSGGTIWLLFFLLLLQLRSVWLRRVKMKFAGSSSVGFKGD